MNQDAHYDGALCEPVLELRIGMTGRRWTSAKDLRQTVTRGLSLMVSDKHVLQRSEMVAEELAENILKYNDWKNDTRPTFYLSLDQDHRTIVMRTSNKAAERRHLANLRAIVNRMKHSSPETAYSERIVEVCNSPDEGTRLGLLRMVCEGECQLDLKVGRGDVLTLEVKLKNSA